MQGGRKFICQSHAHRQTSGLSMMAISLVLIFYMLLLARRARHSINLKYHNFSQTLFARQTSEIEEYQNDTHLNFRGQREFK
jgi:hypothetical protein